MKQRPFVLFLILANLLLVGASLFFAYHRIDRSIALDHVRQSEKALVDKAAMTETLLAAEWAQLSKEDVLTKLRLHVKHQSAPRDIFEKVEDGDEVIVYGPAGFYFVDGRLAGIK